MDFTSEYGQPFLEDKPRKPLVIEKVPARSYILQAFLLKAIHLLGRITHGSYKRSALFSNLPLMQFRK